VKLNATAAAKGKTPAAKEPKTKEPVKKAGSGASGLLLGATVISMAALLM